MDKLIARSDSQVKPRTPGDEDVNAAVTHDLPLTEALCHRAGHTPFRAPTRAVTASERPVPPQHQSARPDAVAGK
ncbi:hypothetical protein [Microbacterium sp. MPKO10]|uniref:hypothetical protein n=1 Tax=Microbacterium sp. MPKO10 TaxID=2989818 RepID=UPI0022354A75|nr:hypothetical protein [Microbacterium sp. MPKO10]MCW4458297.1 hypothetical protein [Microbacterium sp. MPKO10]